MFIDSVKIIVKAGCGGNGCNSLYQDKYTRHPRPDGGDGGKGGNVVFRADKNVFTLYDFKFRQHFTAASGKHGSSGNKKGRDAPDTIVLVPEGTTVIDSSTNCKLRDLLAEGQELIVVKGGEGGIGNARNRNSEDFQGKPGEEKELILDLKLIADVGLVGFPNSGKSTLISKITNAHPKIAAYPFTTKSPVLGVVNYDQKSFSIADIPGLIMDSHLGKGLGDKFLRHVERTRILLHIIDMAGVEGRDPLEDFKTINNELHLYNKEVASKPQILVANKMDLEPAASNLKRFRSKTKKKIYPISALKNEGLEVLVEAIKQKL